MLDNYPEIVYNISRKRQGDKTMNEQELLEKLVNEYETLHADKWAQYEVKI